ncbi:MAG: homoserine dehydrogenase [Candidatus Scalindua sp. AMX11]|nr:MAG: homoserine dehydrogenase [Candidatus Scalindua sp.]NOG85729.1 homoserine dehydrogenase [Planctomycetota bacterium]RZV73177.1 MAG: homoserine dehydrogenase [Candidatus Scalindua sp. SCAELEC01]TDE64734.1 MAG: homoserine dehydrogenase [Candidatus Scalindua sp. AMX11]GJQ58703.1 MAG: homoserine dehydrogenase [Candidatus Scalindua sp.]
MTTSNIGLIGLGTVGSGVAEMLISNPPIFAHKLDKSINLVGVADRSIDKKRTIQFPNSVITTQNYDEIIDNPEVDVIVELIGGIHPAKEIVIKGLENGKDIVTANKALLALHGPELFDIAQKSGKSISFEASVGSCIPVVASLRDSFIANKIEGIYGIVNGTTNYVLTKMNQEQVQYDEALKDAQIKGYAEKEPSTDVDGIDSAHKLTILARMGFNCDFNYSDVYVEGISNVELKDIYYAHELGYTLKLLAISKQRKNGLEIRVNPTLLPHDHPLSSVNGVFNAICIRGDAIGESMLYGQGAGKMPTASAVVADIVDVSLGRAKITFESIKPFSGNCKKINVLDISMIKTRYYLRFSVIDKPGVLASITGILGNHNISISSVIQQDSKENELVPLVMMTHLAEEGNLQKAIIEIDDLDVVKGKTAFLRVEEASS